MIDHRSIELTTSDVDAREEKELKRTAELS